MDEQTQAQLVEGEKAIRLLASEEWKWAREKLEGYITANDSISTLPDTSNELMGESAKARKQAQKIILTWMQDIEGTAEATTAYNNSLVTDSAPMIVEL